MLLDAEVEKLLNQVLLRDRHRLRSLWLKLKARQPIAEMPESARSLAAQGYQDWLQQVEVSQAVCEERAASVPTVSFDSDLPITARREEIAQTLQQRQTLVLCGETGSGKSTQLPKILLQAGFARHGVIGHTQPRRLAARAVAARLAQELNRRIGEQVGFKIRFNDKTAPNTLVKLMTDGVLLAETQSDRFLEQYSAIIIDEAHERSLNIDFLLAYLKRLLPKRPDLKLIITSATIDPQKFADHFADDFGPAPIIEVQGRTYPVEILYRSGQDNDGTDRDGVTEEPTTDGTPLPNLARAIDELCSLGPGDILVFLPTERDIRLAAKYLRGWLTGSGQRLSVDILPLYARLSEAEQNRIFEQHSQRRIVLATNVAESSLTVPGIHFVVDTGVARISRYAPRQRVQRLPIEPIAQASADQRAGRCGRLGPGVCIRLYSPEDYAARARFTTPEIRRSDLAAVLLQCAVLRLGALLELPLLDPPSPEAVRDGQRTLREIGALDENQRLTPIGQSLGKLPCDPRVGRMLLAAHEANVLSDVLVIAAALEAQDVRMRPAGKQTAADEAHQDFRDPLSDFLGLLRLWHFYEDLRSSLSRSRLGKALEQRYLSLQRFREWADIVRQLKEMLATAGYRVGAPHLPLPTLERQPSVADRASSREEKNADGRQASAPSRLENRPSVPAKPEGYAAIHQALLTGLLSGVATASDNRQYQGTNGVSFALWPGSGLFGRQPKWVVTAEIIETTRRYGRIVAEIELAWIEHVAHALLKHSYSDPHWSRKAQAALVYRRSTLYGLPIVERRQTALAPIDRDLARQLMIRHALVQGESQCREKFLLHNQRVLQDLQSLAERARRRDWLVDPYILEQVYAQRLPEAVYDLSSLRKWLQTHQGSAAEQALWFKPEDCLGQPLEPPAPESFPDQLVIGQTHLPLKYEFHPGDVADGITLTIPQGAIKQISEAALGWLVPGLLEEKLLHLIRALPKHLRRNFVPAPDVARKLAQELATQPKDIPFTTAVCTLMSRLAGEPIKPDDFDLQKLPDYLNFRIQVVNDAGKAIDSGRSLSEIQTRLGAQASPAAPPAVSELPALWNGRKTMVVDFEQMPESLMITRGGVKVAAFPTLVDVGDGVTLSLAETQTDALATAQQGWMRLFAIKFRRELTSQVNHLPGLEQACIQLAPLVPASALRDQLRDLIARVAFVEQQTALHTRLDFEARAACATRQISLATQDLAAWLPKLATHYHTLRLALETAPAPWREVADDIQSQIVQLTDRQFLKSVAWQDLREYPRYLQAAVMRWEKLRSGGIPKDRKLREPIERLSIRYRELVAKAGALSQSQGLQQARWLIEELRVSIFAQQLGTRHSVSVKRIDELLSSLA